MSLGRPHRRNATWWRATAMTRRRGGRGRTSGGDQTRGKDSPGMAQQKRPGKAASRDAGRRGDEGGVGRTLRLEAVLSGERVLVRLSRGCQHSLEGAGGPSFPLPHEQQGNNAEGKRESKCSKGLSENPVKQAVSIECGCCLCVGKCYYNVAQRENELADTNYIANILNFKYSMPSNSVIPGKLRIENKV